MAAYMGSLLFPNAIMYLWVLQTHGTQSINEGEPVNEKYA